MGAYDRKGINYESPKLSDMQEVVIDFRTKIYIRKGADPIEAKLKYLERVGPKRTQ